MDVSSFEGSMTDGIAEAKEDDLMGVAMSKLRGMMAKSESRTTESGSARIRRYFYVRCCTYHHTRK